MTQTLRVELPWPPAELSPNRRGHWRKFETARKQAKADGHNAALAAGAKRFKAEGTIPLTLVFQPPDARYRDDDGLIGRLKYYRDGIANAIGVDDRVMHITGIRFLRPEKPGRVFVEMTTD